jgi:hypothetical protein
MGSVFFSWIFCAILTTPSFAATEKIVAPTSEPIGAETQALPEPVSADQSQLAALDDHEILRGLQAQIQSLVLLAEPYVDARSTRIAEKDAFRPVFRRQVQEALPTIAEWIGGLKDSEVRDAFNGTVVEPLNEIATASYCDFSRIISAVDHEVRTTLENLTTLHSLRDERGLLFDTLSDMNGMNRRAQVVLSTRLKIVWLSGGFSKELDEQRALVPTVLDPLFSERIEQLLQEIVQRERKIPLLFPRASLSVRALKTVDPIGIFRIYGFEGDFELELKFFDSLKSSSTRAQIELRFVNGRLSRGSMKRIEKFFKMEGNAAADKFYWVSKEIPVADRIKAVTDSNIQLQGIVQTIADCKTLLEDWMVQAQREP